MVRLSDTDEGLKKHLEDLQKSKKCQTTGEVLTSMLPESDLFSGTNNFSFEFFVVGDGKKLTVMTGQTNNFYNP